MEGKSLNDVFKSFCAGKTEMESKQFSKLIKECKLTDKKFGINDIDIVFAKVKSGKVKKSKVVKLRPSHSINSKTLLVKLPKRKELQKKPSKAKLNLMEVLLILEPKLTMLNSTMIKPLTLVCMLRGDLVLSMQEEVAWLVISLKHATDKQQMSEVCLKNKFII